MDHQSILVIENEKNLGKTFHLLLQRAGHTVTVAINLEEALRCLQKGEFHAILINQQSLDREQLDVFSQVPHLTKDSIHVIFLISDQQTIPRLPENDRFQVSYLLVPTEPEILLQKISLLRKNGNGLGNLKLIPNP